MHTLFQVKDFQISKPLTAPVGCGAVLLCVGMDQQLLLPLGSPAIAPRQSRGGGGWLGRFLQGGCSGCLSCQEGQIRLLCYPHT